ncbi:MAG: hypothetical protein PUD05_04495 [Lachnospiraceae bacterium]|jgi:hypothetical protein|nr:hypothetical protein [Lachnospiraceae bacterium]
MSRAENADRGQKVCNNFAAYNRFLQLFSGLKTTNPRPFPYNDKAWKSTGNFLILVLYLFGTDENRCRRSKAAYQRRRQTIL